jgi:hypothetical protein
MHFTIACRTSTAKFNRTAWTITVDGEFEVTDPDALVALQRTIELLGADKGDQFVQYVSQILDALTRIRRLS